MENVLGLRIVRISEGYAPLKTINGNDNWTKNVWDLREDLKGISNLTDSTAVLMLSRVSSGHFLTIASPIGGRTTDYISAWIYVPATIDISGADLEKIIEDTKQEILVTKRDDEKLEQIYSKPYPLADKPRMSAHSNVKSGKVAYRYYGKGAMYTLAELLDNLSQPYYNGYNSVFLLDKSSGIICTSGDDLSDKGNYSLVEVEAPGIHGGFEPYLDGEKFLEKKCFFEGDMLHIVWKKEGYKDIKKDVTVQQNCNIIPVPFEGDYVRVIPYKDIVVCDELDNPLSEYNLTVENKLICPGCPIELSYKKVSCASVEIRAEGYKGGKNEKCNLSNLPVRFKLEKKEKNENKVERANNIGKTANIAIVQSDSQSDIPSKIDDISTEKPKKKLSIKTIIKTVLPYWLGFTLGFVLAMVVYSINYKDIKSNEDIHKRDIADMKSMIDSLNKRIKVLEPDAGYYSKERALDYLNKNETWKRPEMEKYYHLKGLWDAVNTRNSERIQEFEALTKESSRFEEVFGLVNKIQKGEYTTGKDIVVENFIKFATQKLQGADTPAKGGKSDSGDGQRNRRSQNVVGS